MINKIIALSVTGCKVVGQILPGAFKIWIPAISHCKYMNVKVKLFIILSSSQLRPAPWAYETV